MTRRDYDFEKPRLTMEAAFQSDFQPDLEDYDYPGRFLDRSRGKHLAQRALERHRHDYERAEGESDQPLLVSGHFLELTEHPRADWNQLWLLDEVLHEGKQPQVLEESITSAPNLHSATPSRRRGEGTLAATEFHQGYRNHFTAMPGMLPSVRPCAIRNPRCSAARPPWSRDLPAKRSTATSTAG